MKQLLNLNILYKIVVLEFYKYYFNSFMLIKTDNNYIIILLSLKLKLYILIYYLSDKSFKFTFLC